MAGGNDYLIQVKGNAKRVHNWAKEIAQNVTPLDEYQESKLARGRFEERHYKLYRIEDPEKPEGWESINQLIVSVNSGLRKRGKTKKKKAYRNIHYYITSRKNDTARYLGSRIKGQWGIENKCHWVKDTILYEDKSRVKGYALSGNLSTLRLIVMNLYRLNKEKSIKKQ